jgi:ribose/xylose/arabinose/galactoside ABC-type transport system permease subunit
VIGSSAIAVGGATGFQIFNLPDPLRNAFYSAHWLGLPAPVAMAFLMLAAPHFVLNQMVLGRSLHLLGSNPRRPTSPVPEPALSEPRATSRG